MATTQVALALIATTLVGIALLCWGVVYYTPRILDGSDHGDGSHVDAGRPS